MAAGKCLEVALVYELYEKALRDHGAVDFGDLIMRPALLLESDAALRTEVGRLRHRHVLVDEYQDMKPGKHAPTQGCCGRRQTALGGRRRTVSRSTASAVPRR